VLLLRASSVEVTHAVAAAIAELARAGDMVVLSGEMGAGKTAFAQGFGRALGVTEPITSPTYTLVHSYPVSASPARGRLTLHHADLYRLDNTTELADLGLEELAEYDGIVLVEWGDVVETLLGDHLVIHLEHDEDDPEGMTRIIEVAGVGSSWAVRWDRVIAAVEAFRC
jgi:tRNA threonylcarbamoyladenosine biosynthesis protein TsaE